MQTSYRAKFMVSGLTKDNSLGIQASLGSQLGAGSHRHLVYLVSDAVNKHSTRKRSNFLQLAQHTQVAYLITTPRFIIRAASNLILKHLYLAIFSEKQPEIHTSISFYCHGLLSSLSFSTREDKQTAGNPSKGTLFWVCLSPSPARPMGNELTLPGRGQAASEICLLHNLSTALKSPGTEHLRLG